MASLHQDKHGYRVLFVAPGKAPKVKTRRTLRLGRVSEKFATDMKAHVEALLLRQRSPVTTELEIRLTQWLTKLNPEMVAKLVKLELMAPPPTPAAVVTLGQYLDQFIADRADELKPFTIANLDQCRKRLVDFFGRDRDITTITKAEAVEWRQSLVKRKYARATTGRTVRRAKQFFSQAVESDLILKNPFAKLKGSDAVNRERQTMVERATIDKLLEATPSVEMRLIIALSRYAGLRCPSEHLALRWADVLWDQDRMWVRSPKTEETKPGRLIPIFPELRPYLDAAWDAIGDSGAEFVINKSRDPGVNWRTNLLRLLAQTGVKPWPKLFHAMRASFVTELAQQWPAHIVAEWAGHTPAVALKHYTMAVEGDFKKAIEQTGTHLAQSGPASTGSAEEVTPIFADDCGPVPVNACEGTAPCRTRKTSKNKDNSCGLVESGTYLAHLGLEFDELTRLWPSLIKAVKREILDRARTAAAVR